MIPSVLCVIQIAFEGNLSVATVQKGFAERVQSAGDLIPWTLSTQYQERNFASLLGVRIVRIATHPGMQGVVFLLQLTIPLPPSSTIKTIVTIKLDGVWIRSS